MDRRRRFWPPPAVRRIFPLVLLGAWACGSSDRNRTDGTETRWDAQVVDLGITPDSGVVVDPQCPGGACRASDESISCCCPSGTTCGAWETGCLCVPDPVADSGVSEPTDAGFDDQGIPVDAGFPDSGAPTDTGVRPDSGVRPDGGTTLPPIPVYSGGVCPQFQEGMNNGFMSAGQARSFDLRLPNNPNGAPVVFAWHWLGGQASEAIDWTGIGGAVLNGAIVISAQACCSQWDWQIGTPPPNNVDIGFFDDALACLYDQYSVDLDRIYSTGHSAGAMWTSYLLLYRSEYLAGAVIMSGGLQGNSQYRTPTDRIPIVLVWGGQSDMYGNFSFQTSTLNYSQRLRNDGHFVVHCQGTFGHQIPPDTGYTWPFFDDHPKGITPEPYLGGLPGTFPNWCTIAP